MIMQSRTPSGFTVSIQWVAGSKKIGMWAQSPWLQPTAERYTIALLDVMTYVIQLDQTKWEKEKEGKGM